MTSTNHPTAAPAPQVIGIVGWAVVVFGLPILAVVGLLHLWRPPALSELLVGTSLYVVAGLGISLGWHRYFTHRGFTTGDTFTRLLAVAGCLAFEGSLASWVANHRVHHARTDQPGDPHSPWNRRGRVRGFLHSHLGWLSRPGAEESRYARDILTDPVLAAISRFWWALATGALLIPALLAGLAGGPGAFTGMLVWAGLSRVVLFHHVTWSVNSVCHMYGSRRFETNDQSRNVWWLCLLSFGESWHNNHHHAPRTVRHGVGRRQFDISARLLRMLEVHGLVQECRWPRHTADESPETRAI